MLKFIQAHALTFYPPSNPNRDEGGRPKTCTVGNSERLRLSSQSLKRAIRTSPGFAEALEGHLGSRTQRIGEMLHKRLVARGFDAVTATAHARPIIALFGKLRDAAGETPLITEQLAFLSQPEIDRAVAMVDAIALDAKPLEPGQLKHDAILLRTDTSVDVALFGRMFADAPGYNRDGAVQMAHSFSTNAVEVDSDFYTAVDDLKVGVDDDKGASFIGDTAFGSAVHYLYACVDVSTLKRNLGGAPGADALASAGVKALLRGLATVSPGGKRTSFAHNPLASFLMTEVGDVQPRSLAAAYLNPVRGGDVMKRSIEELLRACRTMDKAYGPRAEARAMLDALSADAPFSHGLDVGIVPMSKCGTLDELLDVSVS